VKIITVNSKKFKSDKSKTWTAKLLTEKDGFRLLLGEFKTEIIHAYLGVIRRGTLSYEFFWQDRWYSIFRFHEPDGSLRNFYCNVNTPPEFAENSITYVDLDIDIVVWGDFTHEVLDMEEFEKNLPNYSQEMIFESRRSLEELENMIKSRKFPFNHIG